MLRKRGSPDDDDDDHEMEENVEEEAGGDDDGDDDMEENLEEEVDGDDDEEDTDEDVVEHSGDVPFLDTFYGLASSSPAERAQAAHTMLNHCLVGPSANSKDAAYAFRRLLNGLCSGRAAARQGYASALTSFLKIANQTGALKEIQEAGEGSGDSVLSFLRNQLVKTTDPNETSGKKKGSEERDHHFGRLFGILSVIRSGILLPKNDQVDLEEIKDVAVGFAKDLVGLYNHRKWIREPTSYAIINLLDSFYDVCPQPEAVEIVKHLISEVVAPELLTGTEVAQYNAEQIAIAVSIQSQAQENGMSLPLGLDAVVLSKDNIPLLAKALSATSVVAQPRVHAVWDVIWCHCLTVPKDLAAKAQKGKPVDRILRKELPGCSDSAQEIVEALIEYVVTESLLGVEAQSGGTAGTNATHERRALAMSLVKVLCGGDSMSSKAGPFRLLIDGSFLERVVLTPVLVRKLFIDVICAGGGKQSGHLLKPMALRVLDSIVVGGELSPDDLSRRLSCAKALLVCDPRFDGRTKSAACMNLLLLDAQVIDEVTPDLVNMWKDYVNFLQERFLAAAQTDVDEERSTSYEAMGYIDLLFNAAKSLTRLMPSGQKEESKFNLNGEIMAFFFVGAFFDCTALKGGGKDAIFKAAKQIKKSKSSALTYALRTQMSARFYSLIADFAVVSTPLKGSSQESPVKQNKDVRLRELLAEFNQGWTRLEAKGCKRLGKNSGESTDPDMISDETISQIVTKQHEAANSESDAEANCLQRFRIGCASLSSALHLHLLRCGDPESLDGEELDLDDDEDDDEADIKELISDLASAQHNLMRVLGLAKKEENDEESENALLEFAEVCAGVLSSPFGASSETRGASPKLLRETVKAAWSCALLLCGQEKPEPSLLEQSLLGLLLASIGAEQEDGEEEDEMDEGSEEDDDQMESDADEKDVVFTEAADADVKDDEEQPQDGGEDDDEEVELDASQLQNFLLQDSDDDESMVLEHHAGADKALAKLIKLKQDARKSGQQARERVDLANQLRCTLLLETVLSNPGRQVDSLFTPEFIHGMILPLLTTRRKLEKSLLSGVKVGKKAGASDSEKRALVEKLTSLMKTKLFKLKTFPEIGVLEFSKLLSDIMDETRKADTDGQLSCCSSALIALCKMSNSSEALASLSSGYGDLVNEWSTKRTTRLKITIFSDLVQQQTRYVPVHISLLSFLSSTNQCISFQHGSNTPFIFFVLSIKQSKISFPQGRSIQVAFYSGWKKLKGFGRRSVGCGKEGHQRHE